MSDKDNDLSGLFSTRSSRARLTTDSKGTEMPSSGTPTPSATVASSNPTGNNNNRRDTQKLSGQLGARLGSGSAIRSSSLSTLGNTILKEVRRELGNEFNISDENGSDVSEANITRAVDRVLKKRAETLDDLEKANIIIHLQKDLLGWGVLQPLIDNPEITDVHVYDYRTVVLQRGKNSEITGINWPNHQAYVSFIDRILLRLGKSLSTAQHTIDASFGNGIRICAVHESVCGARGPYLCIRVPRIVEATLDSVVAYQVAPPIIVDYLASLTRSGLCTMMLAGETGTGKTTLMRCLASQFGPDEAIVSVEDTPELNLLHPFYRCLVSRAPNSEGIGEVTLQEHIKTTLRMTPTRVLLGEMRTPLSAEAFLESAQTGHVGMSTIHARNAKETLVRLESLLGRAQKSVSVDIIRQQIALAVDLVVWLVREKGTGKPRIAEVVEIGHYVEGQIQVRPMFTLVKSGQQPVWRVDSWASNFEEVLADDNIFLGNLPTEVTLNTAGSGGLR